MQIEADNRRRCVSLHIELVGFHGKHGEQIAVRMVARRRARTAISGHSEIGACLQRSRRQLAVRTARALRQFAHGRGDVHDQPVPKARTGRRVGIKTGEGEAFGVRRRARPLQMRRFVAAGAAEAEIGRQNEIARQIVTVLETVADDRERHWRSPWAVPGRPAGRCRT